MSKLLFLYSILVLMYVFQTLQIVRQKLTIWFVVFQLTNFHSSLIEFKTGNAAPVIGCYSRVKGPFEPVGVTHNGLRYFELNLV